MHFSLNEAERQVLILLIELSEPIETPNNTHYTFYPKTIEAAAVYFRSMCVDWAEAYQSLVQKELIQPERSGYCLTEAGAAAARLERLDHPPIWYWYREYYTITARSQAYSRFCEALYGRDLCQTDFSDMDQIEFLIRRGGFQPGDQALDLGCGKGLFAEYLSDCTSAMVSGIDYIPEAVQQAMERTVAKRSRLDFRLGNLDHLDYPAQAFQVITSIDTLYMPNDLPATLGKIYEMLTPGGKLLAFYSAFCFDPNQPRDGLLPGGTDLARALEALGLPYKTWDFTEPTFHLMRKKHELAKSMRAEFESEGTLFLYDHLMAESDEGEAPFDPQRASMTRYLYQVDRGE